MSSNIVHQYFKKEIEGAKIIVKVNPLQWKGTELTITSDGKVAQRDLEFDEDIFEDLSHKPRLIEIKLQGVGFREAVM